jgi:AcrR family transcriptional regulator
MPRTAAQTREHVLQVTHDLFYWHGIRATGVDRIAAEAGIAPTTLYRVFPSKDHLVTEYLDRAHALYREWFDAAAAGGDDPRRRILAVFDALGDQVRPSQCRGCPFLMALAEYPERSHPAHRSAVAMKTWVRRRFGELVADLPGRKPAALADELSLVMEGVYASVAALGVDGPARHARSLAELLLDR